jgi:hypothetical protein
MTLSLRAMLQYEEDIHHFGAAAAISSAKESYSQSKIGTNSALKRLLFIRTLLGQSAKKKSVYEYH